MLITASPSLLLFKRLTSLQEVETGHSVVRTRGPLESKFTFTAHEAGDHSICLSAASSSSPNTHIKLYLDIVVGSTRPNIEQDRSHVSNLASKIRDLNQKLDDIRREQQYQREREASYRDLSEATNSRAVWYSVLQIGVLLTTCIWQLRHLKVGVFDSLKFMGLISSIQCSTFLMTEKLDSSHASFYIISFSLTTLSTCFGRGLVKIRNDVR